MGYASTQIPSTEFNPHSELSQFKQISAFLLDARYSVWLKIDGSWIKILNVRNSNDISTIGKLQSGRPRRFFIFRICRATPFRFPTSTLNKSAAAKHVAQIPTRPDDEPTRQPGEPFWPKIRPPRNRFKTHRPVRRPTLVRTSVPGAPLSLVWGPCVIRCRLFGGLSQCLSFPKGHRYCQHIGRTTRGGYFQMPGGVR